MRVFGGIQRTAYYPLFIYLFGSSENRQSQNSENERQHSPNRDSSKQQSTNKDSVTQQSSNSENESQHSPNRDRSKQQSPNSDNAPGSSWISDWLNKSEAGATTERLSPTYEPKLTKEMEMQVLAHLSLIKHLATIISSRCGYPDTCL